MATKKTTCPYCGKEDLYPALSRLGSNTKICSDCGQVEALISFGMTAEAIISLRTESDKAFKVLLGKARS